MIKEKAALLRPPVDLTSLYRPLIRVASTGLMVLALSLPCVGSQTNVRANPTLRSDTPSLDASKLSLRSAAVLVVDERDNSIVYGKQIATVKPIASITKLMTAMVVLDARVPMDQMISIREEDKDRLRFSRSRLRIGKARLTRGEMLLVTLMSSDNRAAAALGRTTFPSGTRAFVAAMNRKAQQLEMRDSRFADPSGLDGGNVSTAVDLVKMMQAARRYRFIREVTTRPSHVVLPYENGAALEYRNTNPLVRNENPNWTIGLSKTGYLNEAGRCLVMQAEIKDRSLYIVLLDSHGKLTPVGDSNRLRKWLEAANSVPQ
jgi:D-alanyl-D-alanine endopeptidase (penicillin-binding protein 7)